MNWDAEIERDLGRVGHGTSDPGDQTEPTPGTIARLLSATDGIGRGRGRQQAEAALWVMIEAHAPTHDAAKRLKRMARDAGVSGEEPGWPMTVWSLDRTYRQLVRVAEASGWSDPGFLIDPCGREDTQLDRLARIARARHTREAGAGGKAGGDDDYDDHDAASSDLVVAWIEAAAAREEGPFGQERRRAQSLERWPFNASDEMDAAADDSCRMIFGSMSALELCFRCEMARVEQEMHAQPDDLRRPHARLLRLVDRVSDRSLRMSGLALAGLARVYLTQAQVGGRRLEGGMGQAEHGAARELVLRAWCSIQRSRFASDDDDRGCEVLRTRVTMGLPRSAITPRAASATL